MKTRLLKKSSLSGLNITSSVVNTSGKQTFSETTNATSEASTKRHNPRENFIVLVYDTLTDEAYDNRVINTR